MSTDLRVSDGLDTLTPDDVNRLLAIVLCDECTIERRNEGIKELKRRIYSMRDKCAKAESDLGEAVRLLRTAGDDFLTLQETAWDDNSDIQGYQYSEISEEIEAFLTRIAQEKTK